MFEFIFSVISHKKSNTETVPHSFKSRGPRSYVLEKVHKERGIQRIHRPQRVSTSRWWSHQEALENMFFASSEDLFNCLLYTLQHCQYSNESRETVTDADALENVYGPGADPDGCNSCSCNRQNPRQSYALQCYSGNMTEFDT